MRLLSVEDSIASGEITLGPNDCLLVIDMQNDFISPQPNNPVEAPPFQVSSKPTSPSINAKIGADDRE